MKNQNAVVIALLIVSIAANIYLYTSNNEYRSQRSANLDDISYNMHRMADGTIMYNSGVGMGSMMNVEGNMMSNSDMGGMMMNMTAGMKGKTGASLEKVFLEEMVVHHQGAVDMANLLLQDKTIRPELADFANKITAAQTPEIIQMKAWLKSY